ncbi:MAG TPA: transposase, partial [Noviherbaspirillum sp.]
MSATGRALILQGWNTVQHELLPELREQVGALTPKLERVIHTLEWVRIEEFTAASWCGVGRPPHERAWLANAFVAKAVLGLTTTAGLIERLTIDRALRRICGFPLCKRLPSEATFSRAFEEFAEAKLAERVHEALV